MKVRTMGRGSALDVCIVLLLLGSLLSIVGRIPWGMGGEEELSYVTVVLQMENLPTIGAASVSEGEVLYTVAGEAVGSLRSCERRAHRVVLVGNGAVYSGSYPLTERCDLVLMLSLQGIVRDGVLLPKSGFSLAVGSELLLYTDTAELRGTVLWYGENPNECPLISAF